jgi:hypothetical protein
MNNSATLKAVPNSPQLEAPCVIRVEADLYWWTEGDVGLFGQFPECLRLDDPDTEWRGPFETEQEAVDDCYGQMP